MGIRKLGDTITLDFTTHNPFTGAVQNTDSLPTCEVFEDDNDSAILTPSVTKRVGKIGNYRVSIEATALNGFEIGKSYNVIVSATVNSISAKSRISSFTLDSKRNADLNDLAQSEILSDSTPFVGANIDLIKTETDKIQSDIIDNKDAYKADVSALALETTVADKATQSSVNTIKSDTESISAILSTLATYVTHDLVEDIWGFTSRTLSSFGTLIIDIWSYVTRTITSGGITAGEVWSSVTRTLTAGTKDTEIDAIKVQTDKIPSIKTETDKIIQVLGLSQSNYRITSFTYVGELLTEAIIKTYPTKGDVISNTNPIATYKMVATFDEEGKITEYQVTKE